VRWSRFLDPLNAKCGRNCATALHIAAENDAAGVVGVLLNAKADPSLTDDQGDTPLHCAMLYGAPSALNILLAQGAPTMIENSYGELALHHLAEFGLCEDGASSPVAVSEAMTRRHFLRSDKAREVLLAALRESGELAVALDHKAAASGGGTPLHAAARHNHPGAVHAVRLLAEARANTESRDAEDRTPLALAIRHHGAGSKVAATLREMGAKECTDARTEMSACSLQPTSEQPSMASGSACAAGPEEDPLAQALGGLVRPLRLPGPSLLVDGAPGAEEAMEDQGQGSDERPVGQTMIAGESSDRKVEGTMECEPEEQNDQKVVAMELCGGELSGGSPELPVRAE